jgi:hypothetical protein
MFLIQNINMKGLKLIFRIVSYTIEVNKEKERALIGYPRDRGKNCFSLMIDFFQYEENDARTRTIVSLI